MHCWNWHVGLLFCSPFISPKQGYIIINKGDSKTFEAQFLKLSVMYVTNKWSVYSYPFITDISWALFASLVLILSVIV